MKVRINLIDKTWIEGELEYIEFYPLDLDRYGSHRTIKSFQLKNGRVVLVKDIEFVHFLTDKTDA